MKVQLTVNLEIDAENQEECENILENMEYKFSYLKYEDGLLWDEQFHPELDKVKDQEITSWEFKK